MPDSPRPSKQAPALRFLPTRIPEVIEIAPAVFCDDRGWFVESFNARKYREGGIDATFVQDNHSSSRRGTLRGLHAQIARPQGKLVRVVAGEIVDVAVDIRRGSPTFGEWVTVTLSAKNFRQLWLPPGFAHGFCVTSVTAEVEYKVTDFWDATDEITIAWDDPRLAIDWPIREPLLSAKDRAGTRLDTVESRLPVHGATTPRDRG